MQRNILRSRPVGFKSKSKTSRPTEQRVEDLFMIAEEPNYAKEKPLVSSSERPKKLVRFEESTAQKNQIKEEIHSETNRSFERPHQGKNLAVLSKKHAAEYIKKLN